MIQGITGFPETLLVSVVVLTYNSAKYVLETLTSIKSQAYGNIELIISDDCSADTTLEVCRKWIEENNTRFIRTEIITSEKNTGTSANCNRGAKKAEGTWIKFIAGDDLLLPDSIQNFIEYSQNHPLAKAIISKQQSFNVVNGEKTFSCIRPEIDANNKKFYEADVSVKTQYNFLLYRKVLIAGPAYFIKKNLLLSLNYFDEKYRLFEDYPLFMKISENGHRIYFLDKVTVEYRVHENSVSFAENVAEIYPVYYKDWFSFLMGYNFRRLSLKYKIVLLIDFVIYRVIILMGNRGEALLFLKNNYRKLIPGKRWLYFKTSK